MKSLTLAALAAAAVIGATASPVPAGPTAPALIKVPATYQIDAFHTLALRADGTATVTTTSVCFAEPCPSLKTAATWTADAGTLTVATGPDAPAGAGSRTWKVGGGSATDATATVAVQQVAAKGEFPMEPVFTADKSAAWLLVN
ncbi:hypothetical protein H9P43_000560 [Blastocladiella emersonii ATCC 22665]|nr:hypothetical protein H9P43_000560 [Blastocladiella emersonii ATCC 22665]